MHGVMNNQIKKLSNLSEIVFENSKEISFEQKVQNINESIKKIGFQNTANIYSTSDSCKVWW